MKSSEVLNLAADSLERDGWQQGGAGAPGHPRCAMGALKTVLGECAVLAFVDCPPYEAMRRHVGGYVSDWNDQPERTVGEVVAAFRACALVEAAKENADTREQVSA